MDVGEMNLTFKTSLIVRIDCRIENDCVTKIDGDGIDALHFREYLEACEDRDAED